MLREKGNERSGKDDRNAGARGNDLALRESASEVQEGERWGQAGRGWQSSEEQTKLGMAWTGWTLGGFLVLSRLED